MARMRGLWQTVLQGRYSRLESYFHLRQMREEAQVFRMRNAGQRPTARRPGALSEMRQRRGDEARKRRENSGRNARRNA